MRSSPSAGWPSNGALAVAQMNLPPLHTLSLVQSPGADPRRWRRSATCIDGRHRQPALTRMASEEIEAIGQVAGCLHASLRRGRAGHPPRAGPRSSPNTTGPRRSHSLAGLPDWAEVPMELRRTLRRLRRLAVPPDRPQRSRKRGRDQRAGPDRHADGVARAGRPDRSRPSWSTPGAGDGSAAGSSSRSRSARVRKGMIALIRDRDEPARSRAR